MEGKEDLTCYGRYFLFWLVFWRLWLGPDRPGLHLADKLNNALVGDLHGRDRADGLFVYESDDFHGGPHKRQEWGLLVKS